MKSKARFGAVIVVAALLVANVCIASVSQAGAVTTSRGFNGTTIKVAGLGSLSNFTGADVGAEALFKQVNSTNYLKGVKIQFVTFADDQQDPATALSAVRQLVTQDQIFAIVPDLSAVNPGTYLKAQKVPYVGYAFDGTYCSPTPSTSIWGFGYDGCLVPSTTPPVVANSFQQLYNYVKAKTGDKHPTGVLFSNDDQSGVFSTRLDTVAASGAGFKIVYNKATVPVTAADYSPYVQQWMTAANGKQPDMITCLLAAQCIPIWAALKNAGYTGTFYSTLGPISALATAFAGTVTDATYNSQPNAGLKAMEAALQAFQPGTQPIGYSNVPAYFAADMFVQAVHDVQKAKEAITPTNVQKALSTITWSIPGFVGPIKYPASTVDPTPDCSELVSFSGPTGMTVVDPYSCNSKSFKVTAKAEEAQS